MSTASIHPVNRVNSNRTISCNLPSHFVEDDLSDRISTMLQQEGQYQCCNYLRLKSNNKSSTNGVITAASRAKICRWMFHTVKCAEFQIETAVSAMSLLDRFASSKSSPRSRKARSSLGEYQLAALTSLFVVIKMNEQVEVDAATMSLFMRGLYSADAIISCEKDIFDALQWKLNDPTPMQFIRCILDVLPASVAQEIQDESQRQVEVAVKDSACVILNRSSLAVAAVLNSLRAIPQDDFPQIIMAEFVQLLSDSFGMDVVGSPLIKAIRMRLLSRTA